MHRDLYLEALSRIGELELELDGSSLQNLIQYMQDMRVTMVRTQTCSMLQNSLKSIDKSFWHVIVFKDFLHMYTNCVKLCYIHSIHYSMWRHHFFYITFNSVYLSQQTSLSCDTDAALSNMKQMGDIVREDHQSRVSHVCKRLSYLCLFCNYPVSMNLLMWIFPVFSTDRWSLYLRKQSRHTQQWYRRSKMLFTIGMTWGYRWRRPSQPRRR